MYMKKEKKSNSWIVNPCYDLFFFSGSFVLGFLLLGIHYFTNIDAFTVFLVFTLFFNTPHLFNTLYVIFLNRTREKTKLFIVSSLFYLVGPLSLLLSSFLNSRVPFQAFVLISSLYGTWHIFRQHYGFIAMYQLISGEKSGFMNRFEFYSFHSAFILGALIIHSRSKDMGIYGIVSQFSSFHQVGVILDVLFNITVLVFLLDNVVKFIIHGKRLNIPKLILSSCSFFLLIFLVNTEVVKQIEYIFFLAIFTIHHNIQYTALIYIFAKKNFNENTFVQKILTKNMIYFLFFGVCISIIYKLSVWHGFGTRFTSWIAPMNTTIGSRLVFERLNYTVQDIVLSFFFGQALQHYYLDQKIWRMSSIKSKLGL